MNSLKLKVDLEQLYVLNEFIEEHYPNKDMTLKLIVEEIFVNIVNYSNAEYIIVNVESENYLTIELIDNGIQFDPTLKEDPETPKSLDEAQVGGLGIYNNKTNILTFSNAGHEAPLIMEDKKFKPLKVNPGIVLGVMEDFEFVKEETEMSKGIIVYTDGITDAKNPNDEFYGEDKLIDFLNSHPFENKIIDKLLKDIDEFTGPNDQLMI